MIVLPGLFVDILLAQIQVDLAHRATDRDAVGARLAGHVENRVRELDDHVRS